jgi:hypothetical protein
MAKSQEARCWDGANGKWSDRHVDGWTVDGCLVDKNEERMKTTPISWAARVLHVTGRDESIESIDDSRWCAPRWLFHGVNKRDTKIQDSTKEDKVMDQQT